MTVLFLLASLAEYSTKERTHREERTLRPWNVHSTDNLNGMERMESPTHLNHFMWLCRWGRALRNTPTDGSCAWIHRGCVRAHTHTGKLHTDAYLCVSPSSSSLAMECPEACSSAKVAWAARG